MNSILVKSSVKAQTIGFGRLNRNFVGARHASIEAAEQEQISRAQIADKRRRLAGNRDKRP